MVDRRWLWTVPVYLVLGVTLAVALRSAWSSAPRSEAPPAGPRERRAAPGSQLLDLQDFGFSQLARCNTSGSQWIGIVSSAPHHFFHRQQIRDTWAAYQQVVFLLGLANSTIQPLIEKEATVFSDIVQGNFIDSYRNLTYKHTMGLMWATKHCPGAKYILKTDDDVFVNTPYLESYLPTLPNQRLIFCSLMQAALVQRSYRSKWRVTPEEYSKRWYPPYCGGWVILYSPDVAYALYAQAQKEPYFWIDDVHISGTIAEKLNFTHIPLGELGLSVRTTDSFLEGGSHSHFLFSLTSPQNFQRLWEMVNDVSSNNI